MELIGDRADLGDDLIRTKVFECELLVSPWCQGGLHVGLELEVDELSHNKGAVGPVLVGLQLHTILGMRQVLLEETVGNLLFLSPS